MRVPKKGYRKLCTTKKNDRIGLVVYSGEAYSVCHKTTDHQLFQSQLQYVNGTDLVQGTAIGVGLGTGITQLRGDSTSSKAIILLTDGKNNIGAISPSEAAELCGKRKYSCIYNWCRNKWVRTNARRWSFWLRHQL